MPVGNKPLGDAHINELKERFGTKNENLRPWEENFWLSMIDKAPMGHHTRNKGDRVVTPEELWAIACLYFAGAKYDTIVRKDFLRSGESAGKIIEITQERPFSWTSLELFMAYKGIRYTMGDIRINKDGQYDDFKEVVERINQVMYQQKFDGAAVGNYNPQLIIRDLGLAEKVDASVKQEQPLFGDTPQVPTEE